MTADERQQLAALESKVLNEFEHIRTALEEIKNGNTANCASEKARVTESERQIEKLWKSRASAISLNLLWTISVSLYGALIIYLVTHI